MDFKLKKDATFYTLLGGRLLLLLFILGTVYLFPSKFEQPGRDASRLTILFSSAFALSLVSVWWNENRRFGAILPWIQTVGDVLLVFFTIMWTGGVSSPFTFFFPLAIITACILDGRRGGTFSALLSTLAYLLICAMDLHKGAALSYVTFSFFTNMAAFNATALLGMALSRRILKTEKRLVETTEHLNRIEKIQRYIADSMDSGLITTDVDGLIILCNQAASTILGLKTSNFLGKPLRHLWPEGEAFLKSSGKECKNRTRTETTYLTADGQKKILGVSTFSVRDNKNKIIGHGIIFQDITSIKEQEHLLERMRRFAALGEMAAGLAHEIKNPLASLSGAAQFLQEQSAASPQGNKLLDIIIRESSRLNELTESFLMYARPQPRQSIEVDIKKILSEVVELVKRRPGLPQFEMEEHINHTGTIMVDPQQLHQILLNLILNAVQALPSSGGKIRIFTEDHNNLVTISIKDNGKGIEPEDLKKVFDPFFTTKPQGYGLGMAVVHRIIEAWNGTVSIDSSPGRGTNVTIQIPNASQTS